MDGVIETQSNNGSIGMLCLDSFLSPRSPIPCLCDSYVSSRPFGSRGCIVPVAIHPSSWQTAPLTRQVALDSAGLVPSQCTPSVSSLRRAPFRGCSASGVNVLVFLRRIVLRHRLYCKCPASMPSWWRRLVATQLFDPVNIIGPIVIRS